MPLILLGGIHFTQFFSKNWFIIVLFAGTLSLFNIYFIQNWRFFQLLENEDWISLISYLEERIYNKEKLKKSYLKILINAYLVTSDTSAILRLKSHVQEKKPALIGQFSIQFSIPYLLDNKPEESQKFFGKMLAEKKLKNSDWVRWNYAFSLVQLKEYEAAKLEFNKLTENKNDPIVVLLSLYMLNSFSEANQITKEELAAKVARFKSSHNQTEWNKKIEQSKGNIQVLIFTKIIKDASDWIFKREAGPGEEVLQ
jgi:hypothetical protein